MENARCLISGCLALGLFTVCCGGGDRERANELTVTSSVPYLQVEVGGPFVGIEAHHCAPLLSRVSFFYPVANSLDNSQDYWSRDSSHVFALAVGIDDQPPHLLEAPARTCSLAPFSATYLYDSLAYRATISYEFCLSAPAMLVTVTLRNNRKSAQKFRLRSHLDGTLRTSHSYAAKDEAWSEWQPEKGTVVVHYTDPDTGPAELFVVNVGHPPTACATDAQALAARSGGRAESWLTLGEPLSTTVLSNHRPGAPVIAFEYEKRLRPGETVTVKQIIGQCGCAESAKLTRRLRKTYCEEVRAFRRLVLHTALKGSCLRIQDSAAAQSATWAKAIMAVNAHFLAGKILPMPCPAQYNFFFTHDALLTDLAACMFDVDRVRRDLRFLFSLADSLHTLPHAYYWKDDGYVTEYAGADNWNHLWLVMVLGRFLRHSGDNAMVAELLPMVDRSVRLVLTHLHEDDLIWAYRPDWWDIGNSYGPRTYMTALTIAALREYVQLLLTSGRMDSLAYFEELATRMQRALSDRLWDPTRGFLMNYLADGELDPHYYIGSLLPVALGLLVEEKARALVETARRKLVDSSLGVRNASPVDFDQLIAKFRFHGDEAGPPYRYLNGGIWAHGNAWYALALDHIGARQEAYDFISRTMSLHGIAHSPHGQPAMYEYRCADARDSLRYGRVDKPQFLWAAGWYLYSIFAVYGLKEDEWNLYLAPFLPQGQREFMADWMVRGKKVRVTIRGEGPFVRRLLLDGRPYPSAVVPLDHGPEKRIDIELGTAQVPYIAGATSTLRSASIDERARCLSAVLAAFPGHMATLRILSPWMPASVSTSDGRSIAWETEEQDGMYLIAVHVVHRQCVEQLNIQFSPRSPAPLGSPAADQGSCMAP